MGLLARLPFGRIGYDEFPAAGLTSRRDLSLMQGKGTVGEDVSGFRQDRPLRRTAQLTAAGRSARGG